MARLCSAAEASGLSRRQARRLPPRRAWCLPGPLCAAAPLDRRRSTAIAIPMPRLFLLSAGLIALALSGCKAHTDAAPALLSAEMKATVNGVDFVPGTPFAVAGRQMTSTTARVYLTELVLLHEDGREVRAPFEPITLPARNADGETVQHVVNHSVAFFVLDGPVPTDRVRIGEVPEGRYRGVRVKLGMDGLTNRVDASQAPAGHPLARRTDVSNYWNWNSGYIFARFDGQMDTDGNGTPDAGWALHFGRSENATVATLESPFELRGGAEHRLRLELDIARLLAGVDYADAANRSCHSGTACAQAVGAVRAALPSALRLRGVVAAN